MRITGTFVLLDRFEQKEKGREYLTFADAAGGQVKLSADAGAIKGQFGAKMDLDVEVKPFIYEGNQILPVVKVNAAKNS